jgi:hypothetical protein
MITAKAPNRDEIARMIFDPEIFERSKDDFAPDPLNCDIHKADLSQHEFIGGYVDDEIASLFVVHKGVMHFSVLKHYRRYARELLDVSIKIWNKPVAVEIPSLFRSVINFARNYGFVETHITEDFFVKNGKKYRKHHMEYCPCQAS